VEVIPGKIGGVPVITGTRVQVGLIPESAELGETAEEIAYNYDLELRDVRRLPACAAEHRATPVAPTARRFFSIRTYRAIRHEQNMTGREIAVVYMSDNHCSIVKDQVSAIADALLLN
jgi:uncharacterized protein (DUF433 family)